MHECDGEFVGGVINELFLVYFYFVHSWGGHKSRQADLVEKGTWWVGIGGVTLTFKLKY